MKNKITVIFAGLLAICAFNTAEAQFRAVGAGLMYGSETEKLGVRVDGVYQINEEFRAVADLGIFFPESNEIFGTDYKTTWWELNVNGNYLFYTDPEQGLQTYALAGLNLTTVKVKVGDESDSESEAGLNIGIGGEYNLDFANLFGEIKYVLGDADQLNIGIGLRFPIGN